MAASALPRAAVLVQHGRCEQLLVLLFTFLGPQLFVSAVLVLVPVSWLCTGAFLHVPVVPCSPTALRYSQTSQAKVSVELQSLRTELGPSIYHRVALILLLDPFPECKLAPGWFWFQDVLLQIHVLPSIPQAAGNTRKTRQKVRRSKSSVARTAQVDPVQHGMALWLGLEECWQLYPCWWGWLS